MTPKRRPCLRCMCHTESLDIASHRFLGQTDGMAHCNWELHCNAAYLHPFPRRCHARWWLVMVRHVKLTAMLHRRAPLSTMCADLCVHACVGWQRTRVAWTDEQVSLRDEMQICTRPERMPFRRHMSLRCNTPTGDREGPPSAPNGQRARKSCDRVLRDPRPAPPGT